MGVSIHSKGSEKNFDMGYGGFFLLRSNIASAMDKEFGEAYKKLVAYSPLSEDFAKYDSLAQEIIERNHLEENFGNVLDFLYAPDTDGRISYQTCKEIFDIIDNVDFGDNGFRYRSQQHNDYQEFKDFLLDCVVNQTPMMWD